jgi:predicted enzyme related to lactoylglutathione lyase
MADGQQPAPATGAISHVEITGDDVARLQTFYGNCFGWTFQYIPEMDYTLFQSGQGGIGGGLMKRKPEMLRQHVNFLNVLDLDASLGKVMAEGGKVLKGRTEVPGAGVFAIIADPDGNGFGLWQSA